MRTNNIIEITNKDVIAEMLCRSSAETHFTNGIYAAPGDVILPTTLAGFQCVLDNYGRDGDGIAIGVNTDKSIRLIYDAKIAKLYKDAEEASFKKENPEEWLQSQQADLAIKHEKLVVDHDKTEDQFTRAEKLAGPLQNQFFGRRTSIVFYDEETPESLYTHLHDYGVGLGTIFKWGFGLDPKGPRIEGASSFRNVVAIPYPNEVVPIAADITKVEDQSKIVKVIKPYEADEKGRVYITREMKLLMPLHPSLERFAAQPQEQQGLLPQAPTP